VGSFLTVVSRKFASLQNGILKVFAKTMTSKRA